MPKPPIQHWERQPRLHFPFWVTSKSDDRFKKQSHEYIGQLVIWGHPVTPEEACVCVCVCVLFEAYLFWGAGEGW